MKRLTWYARRLQTMGAREIAWRAGRVGQKVLSRDVSWDTAAETATSDATPDWDRLLDAFRECESRPVLLDRTRAKLVAADNPELASAVVAAAERALAGEVRYFGYPPAQIGTEVDWNLDPMSGYRWPTANSDRIDHRVAGSDPKWIWELNRLQHLPWLAQAWLITGEDRFADAAFSHLDRWTAQQPPGTGIAWRGAFECGIRAISISIALQGLRDAPGLTTERYRRIVALLNESARRCWRERSLYSSANNHLIGELAGLATASILFPELASASRWEDQAIEALAQEADRQILPDGASAEQAIAYQLFTGELLAIVAALLTLRGDRAPAPIVAAIERSARYLATVVGEDGPQPRYGDDDGGFALRLGAERVRTVREHLGIVAALTGDPIAARYGHASMTSAWLRAALGTADGGRQGAELPKDLYAPDGGLVVLRSGDRRFTMDVAPLGYLSIAAHGHADALSITLGVGSRDLIGDTGTGSYYGHPGWRNAHRSTRMHSTVCVDGTDQSMPGGPFMWSEHAAVRVRAVDLARGIVDAEHDGYRRLADPVAHRRWLFAPPNRSVAAVVDLISGAAPHTAQVSWPLHPSLAAVAFENGHLVTQDGNPVLRMTYGASVSMKTNAIRGDEQTDLGWWSELLESRTPAWLIGAAAEASAPFVVVTLLESVDATESGQVEELDVRLDGNNIDVTWLVGDVPHRLAIDIDADGAVGATP